jgi:pentatricopeptide repeat protein
LDQLDHEPASTLDDTQPRPPVIVETPPTVEDTSPVKSETQPVQAVEPVEPRGCGNRLLISAVLLAFFFLCVTSVGLAALAGWRDGVTDAQVHKATALVGTVGAQAALASDDCTNGRYELCKERCVYISTVQPFYPGIGNCLSTAQSALNVTPTATATTPPTAVPPTFTPTLTASNGDFSREELFIRATQAYRTIDYESTVKWLEALRGLDANYRRQEVEDMLVVAYQALGKQYQEDGRLSEMIVAVKKALKIRPLPDTNWEFTVNATQLYLDAKGYVAAGDFGHADSVFKKLLDMGISPDYLDAKRQACQVFASAGDTAATQRYKC